MPVQTSYQGSTPVDLLNGTNTHQDPNRPEVQGAPTNSKEDEEARTYVLGWRNKLRTERIEKVNIWNECWSLYRGQANESNKEDWQSKIVLPKAWGTVKQATNVIKRFLNTAKKPWYVDTTTRNNPVATERAEKMTDVIKFFTEKAHMIEEFSTGLETAFIIGLGVWKTGWGLIPRMRMKVQTQMVPYNPGLQQPYSQPELGGVQPDQAQEIASSEPLQPPPQRGAPQPLGQMPNELQGQQNTIFPTQLPNEAQLRPGALSAGVGQGAPVGINMVPQKQVVRQEVLEGNLFIWAVDPYSFYWLPGSKFNRWTGTIEEIEVPKWQLIEMAELGAFDPEVIKNIGPMKIDEYQRQSWVRWGELPRTTYGPTQDTGTVKLTEFYGPITKDGVIVEKHAHVILANDTWVLKNGKNEDWTQEPPYVAFSPLILPFRAEGVGLVEMVRSIDHALNQIVNLGVDTLLFRLLPIFEFTPDVYENPEDLRTGLTPGKVFRRNSLAAPQDMGLRPIEFQDVSPGAAQYAGILDRAHQEGGLVSELQQSLPRWSGAQTATETEAIQENQSSFFGSLASDIEQYAIAPLIKMCLDKVMQYIDTANDPRIAQILGVDQGILAGMSHAEIYEMISGDYDIVVRGLSGQLEKAEMLQNLIQMMNLIGQNPQAWLPYLNQDALLRRILESFQPAIHDIEDIIADPQTVQANKAAMQQQEQMGQMVGMLPELARLAHETSQTKTELATRQQESQQQAMGDHADRVQKAVDQAIQLKQIQSKGASNETT